MDRFRLVCDPLREHSILLFVDKCLISYLTEARDSTCLCFSVLRHLSLVIFFYILERIILPFSSLDNRFFVPQWCLLLESQGILKPYRQAVGSIASDGNERVR